MHVALYLSNILPLLFSPIKQHSMGRQHRLRSTAQHITPFSRWLYFSRHFFSQFYYVILTLFILSCSSYLSFQHSAFLFDFYLIFLLNLMCTVSFKEVKKKTKSFLESGVIRCSKKYSTIITAIELYLIKSTTQIV